MKDNKLEVGDKLCYQQSFDIVEIERLTKTQAVSKEGIRFRIVGRKFFHRSEVMFYQIGGDCGFWELLTPKNQIEIDKFRYKTRVEKWFKDTAFTFEQKEMFYNLINKDNA